ncbi:hypothetical protein AgCh_024246 [Apium graveolens]
MLLRERQKSDSKGECFGVGNLMKLHPRIEESNMDESTYEEVQDHAETIYLTKQEIIGNVKVQKEESDASSEEFTNLDYDNLYDQTGQFGNGAAKPISNIESNINAEEMMNRQEPIAELPALDVESVKKISSVHDNQMETPKSYVAGFEKNLKEFVHLYERCLNSFEVIFALFPNNDKLVELKKEYMKYIKMFADGSPIAKNLPVGILVDDNRKRENKFNDEDYLPNYSLGLSQMTPKNLRTDMEGIAKGSSSAGESQNVVSDMFDAIKTLALVESKPDKDALMMRPRWEVKATPICRSLYISRVVDVSGHIITTEEKKSVGLAFS